MSENYIVGIVTLLLAGLCFTLAYYYGKREQTAVSLLFLFLGGLILRLSSGLYFFLEPWDERYHALVARNMLNHPFIPTLYESPAIDYNLRDWGASHIWLHKPPITLWLIALSLKVFGINAIAVRLPSIILSSLCIVLTFLIAQKLFDKKTALFASFLHAIHGMLIELATGRIPTDHVDTIFIFFIELGVLLAVLSSRKCSPIHILFIGFITGCSLLTKSLPGLIILAVYFVLLLERESWKQAFLYCGGALLVTLLVALPWTIYTYAAFPREAAWENYFNTYRHLTEPLEGHSGSIWYHIKMIPRVFGELSFIPLVYFFYLIYKKRLPYGSYALILWFVLPYIFFSCVATKMPGYVMISAPAILIILAKMYWVIKENFSGSKFKPAIVILLALMVLLPIRYSYERIRPFRIIDRNPGWTQELQVLNSKVQGEKAAVFNVEHNIEAMFYTNVSAYPFIPDKKMVDQAAANGFRVFIYDDQRIPAEIRTDNRVEILHPSFPLEEK
jgi:4-amino-4-deoxy-L-arabinose transferase and related glycosyltransferases of PMT family